jgi:hypothetical protein
MTPTDQAIFTAVWEAGVALGIARERANVLAAKLAEGEGDAVQVGAAYAAVDQMTAAADAMERELAAWMAAHPGR